MLPVGRVRLMLSLLTVAATLANSPARGQQFDPLEFPAFGSVTLSPPLFFEVVAFTDGFGGNPAPQIVISPIFGGPGSQTLYFGGVAPPCGTGPAAAVFAFEDLTLPAGVTLRVSGSRPLALLARNTMTIGGVIDARGRSATSFTGAPGGGGPHPPQIDSGGGGGGLGGRGGAAGDQQINGARSTQTHNGASASLDLFVRTCLDGVEFDRVYQPLVAGSGGAGGAALVFCCGDLAEGGAGGGGGGAVYLAARGPMTITGVVDARGGDGSGDLPGRGESWPGGGGSGGFIQVFAYDTLTSTGVLTANGGAAGPAPFEPDGASSVYGSGGGGGGGVISVVAGDPELGATLIDWGPATIGVTSNAANRGFSGAPGIAQFFPRTLLVSGPTRTWSTALVSEGPEGRTNTAFMDEMVLDGVFLYDGDYNGRPLQRLSGPGSMFIEPLGFLPLEIRDASGFTGDLRARVFNFPVHVGSATGSLDFSLLEVTSGVVDLEARVTLEELRILPGGAATIIDGEPGFVLEGTRQSRVAGPVVMQRATPGQGVMVLRAPLELAADGFIVTQDPAGSATYLTQLIVEAGGELAEVGPRTINTAVTIRIGGLYRLFPGANDAADEWIRAEAGGTVRIGGDGPDALDVVLASSFILEDGATVLFDIVGEASDRLTFAASAAFAVNGVAQLGVVPGAEPIALGAAYKLFDTAEIATAVGPEHFALSGLGGRLETRSDGLYFVRADPPCNAADVTDPLGLLTAADVEFFVMSPSDLNADARTDSFDVFAYLNVFDAGCG